YGLQDAAEGLGENLPLQVELVGRQGEIVGREQVDVSVQAGRPVSVTLSLTIDAAARPARALLRTGAIDTNGDWLPVTHARGENLESPYPVALVKIAPSAPVTAAPQHPAGAQFGEALTLLGYDVAQPDEQTLDLTLYWQALNRPAEDYTFFVHMLDAAGQVLSQWDGQPDAGAYPTSI